MSGYESLEWLDDVYRSPEVTEITENRRFTLRVASILTQLGVLVIQPQVPTSTHPTLNQ